MFTTDNIVKDALNRKFNQHLPSTLYKNHYELSQDLGGTPDLWKQFLKDPETNRFIELEIASITESAARSALKSLGTGATSSEIAAAKQLLENSKLLQQKHNPKQHVILTYLPPRNNENQPKEESNHEN